MSAGVLAAGDERFYRAEPAGNQWMCITGNDWQAAPLYDTEEEAQDAADEMNGLYYADGTRAEQNMERRQMGFES